MTWWRTAQGRDCGFLLLSLCLVFLGIASLLIGAAQIPLKHLAALCFDSSFAANHPVDHSILFNIRLPRVLTGLVTGALLGMSGAIIQGIFRNPLAEPGLIGISSGATLGGVISIVFFGGSSFLWGLHLPFFGFLGSIAAVWLVSQLGMSRGRVHVPTLLLAGIAINAMTGAVLGLLMYISDDQQLRSITFWTMGSLGRSDWNSIRFSFPFLIPCLLLIPLLARPLNALLLGEPVAGHLGFTVEGTKRKAIILASLAVGASLCFTGLIGFIGLVAPHLVRIVMGPDHRGVIVGSGLLGAVLLMAADLLARTMVAPAELPIGILTAALGTPFFLYLLKKQHGTSL